MVEGSNPTITLTKPYEKKFQTNLMVNGDFNQKSPKEINVH
jgi:hypothetical protein